MNTDGFVQLRKAILDQSMSLLDSDSVPLEERYALSVQIAETQGTLEAYETAFRLAQQLEGADKLSSYLDLLAGVDEQIQRAQEQPVHSDQNDGGQQQDGQG